MKFADGAWWTGWLARGLSPADRETVLGDLAEAGETGGEALRSVAGLLIRRQLTAWRTGAPWIAAFGLAMPASFLLMGLSVSIAQNYQSAIGGTARSGLTRLLADFGLLAAWSAAGGFAVGTISRRTTWVSAACSLLACTFCLARFRMASLSPLCLFLFLPPAMAGLWFGLRASRIRLDASLAVAIATAALTIPHASKPGAWLPSLMLSWPAWYLAAIAWRRETRQRSIHGK